MKFVRFTDPLTGSPMVRFYRQRITEPISAAAGETASVTVDGERFRGVVKETTTTEVVLAL